MIELFRSMSLHTSLNLINNFNRNFFTLIFIFVLTSKLSICILQTIYIFAHLYFLINKVFFIKFYILFLYFQIYLIMKLLLYK